MWIADLASMAVVQVWKGTSKLPSMEEMNKQIDAHHAWLTKLAERETAPSDFVQEEPWLKWCNEVPGTGIDEHLGWRISGWRFSGKEMSLSNLIMGGVETPFVLRLFEGKRKKWDGARRAIIALSRILDIALFCVIIALDHRGHRSELK
jgi:dimethylaniline monooxygenase (N-oxide forming)